MKIRTLLLTLCTAIALCACNTKSLITPDPTPTTSITALVDGKLETFNSKDSTRSTNPTGIYLTGSNDTTSDKIMLFINNGSPLASNTVYASSAGACQMLFGVGPGYTFNNYYYQNGQGTNSTLTVTSYSSTNIQGTFSGMLVLEQSIIDGGPTYQFKTITNGKFNIILSQ